MLRLLAAGAAVGGVWAAGASATAAADTAAAAAAAAPTHRLFGYGLIDGATTFQIAAINVTDASVSWSAPFTVRSTDQGCNVAFAVERGEPVYYVPDGSPLAPPGSPYHYHTVAVNGTVLRTVKASLAYDPVFVGYDPVAARAFGLGSLPPAGSTDPTTDLFSFSPVTGATATDAANLTWVQEMPSCVGGGTGAGDGFFYFVNGIISHTTKQSLVSYDVATGRVDQRRVYDGGLISSIAPWTAPNGTGVVLALLWPQPAGDAQLVAVSSSAHKWEPTLLHTFTGGETPNQGALTVVGSTAYALMQGRGGAGAGGDLLMAADLAATPVAVTLQPIDDSHAPYGVYALGGFVVA